MQDDQLASGRVVFITDCEHLKLAHIKKLTPNLVLAVASIIGSSFPSRIAALHAIHLPQFAEWVLNLAKSILKDKIVQRVI